ncbi:hypothetical protein [Haliangium sp.]|uniref:hypothetical protein n=1 Tax=Haliangium sp. TaxID=2663208 RepID=UPI003D0D2911
MTTTVLTTPRTRAALTFTIALIGLGLGLSTFAGCESQRDRSTSALADPAVSERPPAAAAARVTVDARTQYQLATDIATTERMRPDEAAVRLSEIQRDWQGKRYRWQVAVIPALCRAPQRCNVMPFDTGGTDRAIVQGWLPRLDLDDDAFAAIEHSCRGKARCRIEFEGTLSKLVLSTDAFTSLGFHDVEIL